jgi:hypothetical protein
MTEPDPNTVEGFLALVRICEHRARCHVQGSAHHPKLKCIQPLSGRWSVHFKSHPRVIEAEAEGWGRDLRAAIVAECKRRLLEGKDFGEPDDLMPTRREWWEGVRANAERFRLAEIYREQTLGPVDAEPKQPLPRVDREAWRARREGRMPKPIQSITGVVLTDISKRMTGEA